MAKIVSFNQYYDKPIKRAPLSLKMIRTLQLAYQKQQANIPFGPYDLKGSCAALINRGFIERKPIEVNGVTEDQWQVSGEAIVLLHSLALNLIFKP